MYNNDLGKYDVYTEIGSIYCYRDSHVLRNKFGIRDYQTLRQIETDISTNKQHYLMTNPICGRFTSNHLCKIHQFLFGDIYSFAGHFRHENIRKGDTSFLDEKDISHKLQKLLASLQCDNYLLDLSYDQFISRLAYYLAEINYIHPFREGNGRSTREFMRLLIAKNGYSINWTAAGVERLMDAMIESVYDVKPLVGVLEVAISAKNAMV